MAVAEKSSEPVIIDVRTVTEYEAGHVEGALNIPHTEIGEQIQQNNIPKDAEIKLYCGSGRRAGIAEAKLEEMGYRNVTNIGGYDDIKDAY